MTMRQLTMQPQTLAFCRAEAALILLVLLAACERSTPEAKPAGNKQDASEVTLPDTNTLRDAAPGKNDTSASNPGGMDVAGPTDDVAAADAPLPEQPDAIPAVDSTGSDSVDDATTSPLDVAQASDACGTPVPGQVTLYRPANQEPSTGRSCLCFPYGTFCRWPDWSDESIPPSLEDESKACPEAEACDGWFDGKTWYSGEPGCRKRCYHPKATWDKGAFDDLGCAEGEYCKFVGLDGVDGQISGLHGLCYPIPVSADVTNCIPPCAPGDACGK